MEKPEERKLAVSELVARSFGIIMVVLYPVIGTTIIFKARDNADIPQHYALIIGILFIVYGLFRGYKLYQKYYSSFR